MMSLVRFSEVVWPRNSNEINLVFDVGNQCRATHDLNIILDSGSQTVLYGTIVKINIPQYQISRVS